MKVHSKKSEVLKSDSMICGKRKRVQQEVPQTIVYSFGSIALLERTLRSISEDLSKAQASFNDRPQQDCLEILRVFTSNLEAIKQLKTDFEQVVKQKKLKLEQVERIAMSLTSAREEKLELVNALKVEEKRVKEVQRPGKLSRSISQQALLQIEIECRAVVAQCLRKYSLLELVNGELECSCCRDD